MHDQLPPNLRNHAEGSPELEGPLAVLPDSTSHATRRRLVTFRFREEEYEAVRTFCETTGARSISDFVRESILQRIRTRNPRVLISNDLGTLSTALEDIDSALRQLSGKISKVLAPAPKADLRPSVPEGEPEIAEPPKAAGASAGDDLKH